MYRYEKNIVRNIVIEGEYSLNGNELVVSINKNGIDINVKTLSKIRQLSNLDPILTINKFYSTFFNILNLKTSINYTKILGKIKSSEYFNYIKKEIMESINLVTSYHLEIFPIRNMCYLNLADVYLEGKLLEKPVYNHSGVTGRTSITKGFNFLTLKKEIRKDLTIDNSSLRLVELDFKSCEPFFYLKSQGFDVPDNDVYLWLCEKYKIDFKDRAIVKRGILSMIYGANAKTISRIMKLKESKINLIKEELGINKLKIDLEKEFSKNGYVLNYYGRPITSNNNLVNYWIQSSAVDYCSLAFSQFKNQNKIKPVYFIHDSMTFQIHKAKLNDILQKKYIKEEKSNITIPIEYTIIS
jgi:hypothetical protein